MWISEEEEDEYHRIYLDVWSHGLVICILSWHIPFFVSCLDIPFSVPYLDTPFSVSFLDTLRFLYPILNHSVFCILSWYSVFLYPLSWDIPFSESCLDGQFGNITNITWQIITGWCTVTCRKYGMVHNYLSKVRDRAQLPVQEKRNILLQCAKSGHWICDNKMRVIDHGDLFSEWKVARITEMGWKRIQKSGKLSADFRVFHSINWISISQMNVNFTVMTIVAECDVVSFSETIPCRTFSLDRYRILAYESLPKTSHRSTASISITGFSLSSPD